MMFGNLGPSELLIALLLWFLPLAACVWVLVTLARLRRGQDAILARLASLEVALSGPRRPGS